MLNLYDKAQAKKVCALVMTFALSQTRDKDLAEEVRQNVMLNLLSKDSSKVRHSGAWLRIAVRNMTVNMYRNDPQSFEYRHSVRDNIATDESNVVARVCEDPTVALDIQGALAAIPESQRRALQLHASGYSYGEIAQLCRANIGTIRSRIHYARLSLRRLLSDY
jgi:RNA polymerase sigma factor (sigma-70 family)